MGYKTRDWRGNVPMSRSSQNSVTVDMRIGKKGRKRKKQIQFFVANTLTLHPRVEIT